MALIQRPIKTLGNREYAQEKAANPNEPIKSAEVDGDLDTIYALVNGNLDTANLKASANIVGTQLAPGANILGSQLSPTAGITAGQLAPGTLTGAQLAVGAAVRGLVFSATTAVSVSTTETPLCTLSLTTHGGLIMIGGWWDASVVIGSTAGGQVLIKVKRDTTTVLASPGPNCAVVSGVAIQVPMPPPWLVDNSSPAGAHTYTITAQTQNTSLTFTCGTNGLLFAVEFA